MLKEKSVPKIKLVKDGPYLVLGNIPLKKQTIVADREGHVSVRFLANIK